MVCNLHCLAELELERWQLQLLGTARPDAHHVVEDYMHFGIQAELYPQVLAQCGGNKQLARGIVYDLVTQMLHSELNVGWCPGGVKGSAHPKITGYFSKLSIKTLKFRNCGERERTRAYVQRMAEEGKANFADVWAFGVDVWLNSDRNSADAFLRQVKTVLERNKQ